MTPRLQASIKTTNDIPDTFCDSLTTVLHQYQGWKNLDFNFLNRFLGFKGVFGFKSFFGILNFIFCKALLDVAYLRCRQYVTTFLQFSEKKI